MTTNPLLHSYYCDAGVVWACPSPYGGTAAWCEIDGADNRVREGRLIMPCTALSNPIGPNVMEWAAAILALEQAPDGWRGTLYTDSKNTIGRLTQQWSLNGIPEGWLRRGQAQLKRLGPIKAQYVKGHPTQDELEAGISKRGYPVSRHNAWCHNECARLNDLYLNALPVYSNILTMGASAGAFYPVVSIGPKPLGHDCGYVCSTCMAALSTYRAIECACGERGNYAVPVTVYTRLAEWRQRIKGGE